MFLNFLAIKYILQAILFFSSTCYWSQLQQYLVRAWCEIAFIVSFGLESERVIFAHKILQLQQYSGRAYCENTFIMSFRLSDIVPSAIYANANINRARYGIGLGSKIVSFTVKLTSAISSEHLRIAWNKSLLCWHNWHDFLS